MCTARLGGNHPPQGWHEPLRRWAAFMLGSWMLKGVEIEALSKSGKDMAADPRAHTVSKERFHLGMRFK